MHFVLDGTYKNSNVFLYNKNDTKELIKINHNEK